SIGRAGSGNSNARCRGIDLFPWDDAIAVVGDFATAAYFDPFSNSAGSLRTPVGGKDGFVTKLAADGTWQWTDVIAGANDDSAESVSIGSAFTLYASGSFAGSAQIGSNTLTSPSSSDADLFVTRMNFTSGIVSWAKSVPNSVVSVSSPSGAVATTS